MDAQAGLQLPIATGVQHLNNRCLFNIQCSWLYYLCYAQTLSLGMCAALVDATKSFLQTAMLATRMEFNFLAFPSLEAPL